jgi:hypothetical protein
MSIPPRGADAGNERAGALGKVTGSDFEKTTYTTGGGVKERKHDRVLMRLDAPSTSEDFSLAEIDRRNGWTQSADEIALVGRLPEDRETIDAERQSVGLVGFLHVIDDNVTGRGRIADMHQRFLNFTAASWLIDAPFVRGLGLREVAESVNVSHETFRLRAERIAGALGLRMKTLTPEHKRALQEARDGKGNAGRGKTGKAPT